MKFIPTSTTTSTLGSNIILTYSTGGALSVNKPVMPRSNCAEVDCKNLAQQGRSNCRTHQGKGRVPNGKFAYRAQKKAYCERCGFVAEHPMQLDVHHLDHTDRENSALQTLCANCHRLQTALGGHSLNARYRNR